jgi:hypothetical protein
VLGFNMPVGTVPTNGALLRDLRAGLGRERVEVEGNGGELLLRSKLVAVTSQSGIRELTDPGIPLPLPAGIGRMLTPSAVRECAQRPEGRAQGDRIGTSA